MLNAMKYIYTVYETKSFSIAAEKLFISQPALSIAVRKEEEACGSVFFDRNSHPLKLTPAGELYIQKAKEMLQMENELKQQLADLSNLSTGELSISGTQYINSYILPSALHAFMQKYPGIRINIQEHSPGTNLKLLQNGLADLSFNAGTFDPQVYAQTPVLRDRVLLAVPADYEINQLYQNFSLSPEQISDPDFAWSEAPKLPASCFAEIPMIFLSPGTNLHQIAAEICHDAGFEPNIIFMLDQSTTIYNLARAGIGAVWVSYLIVRKAPSRNLCYYQIQSDKILRTYYALTSKRHYVSTAAKKFIELCHHTMWNVQ